VALSEKGAIDTNAVADETAGANLRKGLLYVNMLSKGDKI
jgi:hypothetical protein